MDNRLNLLDPLGDIYEYPSPLAGYEEVSVMTPLTDERAQDGKSLVNPKRESLSNSYERFTEPLDNGEKGGFDVHVYYCQTDEKQTKYARELWERVRREFPELRVYRLWDRPIGPHPTAMFEVDLRTPSQFGAFVPWLAIWRGPLSVLIHPNTVLDDGQEDQGSELRNHTQRAIWMGQRLQLNTSSLLPEGH